MNKETNKIIRANWRKTYAELSKLTGISILAVRSRYRALKLPTKGGNTYMRRKLPKVEDELALDKHREQSKSKVSRLEAKQKLLIKELAKKEDELDTLLAIKREPLKTYKVKSQKGLGHSEGVAFLIASDWHIEEYVDPALVSGLNHYDLEESRRRADLFFVRGIRLAEIVKRDIAINTIVIALLGDMITNSIHEDGAESNLLGPTEAVRRCAEYVISGIEYVLDFTKDWGAKIYVPCHTGNHGRMTKERRVATEAQNSLEVMLYAIIAEHFRNEPRVTINISTGYHSYFECFGSTIRFHHGHAMNYGGGVGGITVPINKAIAQWQRARKADLDVFGHFHQYMDGGHFVVNGSLIGYNAYALQIKAAYEKPRQAFFVWDAKRGKTWNAPILFE